MEDIKKDLNSLSQTQILEFWGWGGLIFNFSYIGEKNTNTTTTCAAELDSENFCEQKS